ncbi:MAG: U32 family peptidase [Clostridia bacterium]|nr:U32 family peptidase [Clostridia bacterium]
MKNKNILEILAPAGSYDAFVSAVSAGADAVYLGTPKHNARVNAKNFSDEELKRAFDLASLFDKKIYVTLNTLVTDRELYELLDQVERLINMGADAFIVQDLGFMTALREAFPCITLHASTQCVTHSLEQIKALSDMGVKRAVVARELDRDNLRYICQNSPIEIEAFVHGALCVCHSGDCLFSSLVGGRSGNRGECAQPCRLPFSGGGIDYPLSLSDLSLTDYVTELSEMGVASLKIEGRMKSPEYVGGVVSVFRRLVDEGRNIRKDEKEHLARLFSRNGFTDGYYNRILGRKMYGIRREEDKKETRELSDSTFKLPKIKIKVSLEVTKEGGTLTFSSSDKSVKVSLPSPDIAETRPLDRDFALSQLSKLGDTEFEIEEFDFFADGDYIYPRSALNSARRECAEALRLAIIKRVEKSDRKPVEKPCEKGAEPLAHYVILAPHRRADQEEGERLLALADRVYFPLFRFPKLENVKKAGVVLPAILFDSQREEAEKEMRRLYDLGVRRAYAENVGVAKIAKSIGFEVLGGVRLNVYNSHTAKVLSHMGFEGVLLSPELSPSLKRDIIKALPAGETVYGRMPLMIMENCIINLKDNCRECSDFKNCRKSTILTDRRGVKFPVYPEYFHRCQIFNSVPTYNADKEVTRGMSFRAIFITDEKDSVKTVKAVLNSEKINGEFTRKG